MTKTDVAEKPITDLAMTDMWGDVAGEGLENVGETDVLIPRLTVLQGLSPQLNKKKSEFINGAGVGDICDVGLREVFPDGVDFLPVYMNKVYIEWAPRDSGQGLVGIHEDPAVLDRLMDDGSGMMFTPEGNSISETIQFFGYNITAGWRKSYIPLNSTQLKKGRQWNTYAMSEKVKRENGTEFTPPLWYRTYKLTTGPESNNKGDWEGWIVDRGPKLSEALQGEAFMERFTGAKAFADALKAGEAKADQSHLDDEKVDDKEVAF